jgi:hypothetical protein
MPYTSHGHWVGPTEPCAADVQPRLVARCGGPAMCPECAREAIAAGHTGLAKVAASVGPQKFKRYRYATGDELIELLAAKSHEGYVAGKRASGSTSRLTESGEEVLVPYDQLSESSKDISRSAARAILEGLVELGAQLDTLVKITVDENL